MSTGGSSQNQTGYNSNNFSGSQNGGSLGLTQNNSSASNTSSTSANVPSNVSAAYDAAGNNIDGSGEDAAQNAGQNALANIVGNNTGSVAVQSSINALNTLAPQFQSLADTTYTPYTAAQASAPGQVTAPTAASNMAAYENPYTGDVVNSTLANFDQNTANQLNALHASRDAGSAFGDRANLADDAFLNQAALNRAQTQAGLESQGFTTAAQLGAGDASNQLSANTANASNALQTSLANMNATNTASQANASDALAQQNQDLSALNSAGANAGNTSNLALAGSAANVNNANALFNMGTTGQGQLINLVGTGNPFIGQTATNSSTGANTGLNLGLTANQTQGQSAGTNSSQSNGKSPGISL